MTRHHGSADRFARAGDADVLDSGCDAAFLEDTGPIDPEAPIVAPLAHIGNKRMTPVRDPSRPRRAEDAEGIARPEAALRRRGAG
ncbi:hypothetical protein [Streptomyces sp. 1222.5]|uniref:hypothetical protein n=1 Tax=Streptomyces sp. 1222.5 TaxID=1881026 RepID=UPI003D70609C